MSNYDEVLKNLPQDISQAMTSAQLFKVCKGYDTSKDVSTALSQLYKTGRINRKVSAEGSSGMYLYWNKSESAAEAEVKPQKSLEVKPQEILGPLDMNSGIGRLGSGQFNDIVSSTKEHDSPTTGIASLVDNLIKVIDAPKVSDNKVITQYPTIKLDIAIQMPEMPNTLKLVGLKKSNLDDAIATGEHYLIDVATLDDLAIEQFTAQWAIKFKAHVAARKQLAVK